MKRAILLVAMAIPAALTADTPQQVNFNLVQVNHYHNQQSIADSTSKPVQRVIIDVGSDAIRQQFMRGAMVGQFDMAPVVVNIDPVPQKVEVAVGGARAVPWETSLIVRSSSGADSFKISSSRVGCPGTEVRPSVSVAFAKAGGWSDPPIRFGPLSNHTLCPLGKGYQLEVSAAGDAPPMVSLRESQTRALFGKR